MLTLEGNSLTVGLTSQPSTSSCLTIFIPEFDAEAAESAVFFEYEWSDDSGGDFELLLRWLGEGAGDRATRKDDSDKPIHYRYP